MSIFEELRMLVQTLQESGVAYALCGGFALAVHGFVRATEDIDLLVDESSLPKVRQIAASLGFKPAAPPLRFRDGQVVIHRLLKTDPQSEEFVVLDLLIVTPLIQSAWETRCFRESEFGPVQVVSPAGLVHLKSLRRSGQDEDDIRHLNEAFNET